MEEYKAYLLGPDGRIFGRIDLLCANEDTAIERARQLARECPVELWKGNQKIGEYPLLP